MALLSKPDGRFFKDGCIEASEAKTAAWGITWQSMVQVSPSTPINLLLPPIPVPTIPVPAPIPTLMLIGKDKGKGVEQREMPEDAEGAKALGGSSDSEPQSLESNSEPVSLKPPVDLSAQPGSLFSKTWKEE
ncbi:hypothetical protein BDR06DRAFT_969860 [Suillus hirtellus]|nr:hypothetical protein BDR06DRAFT_969860 [Suillus hirtellus]